MRSADNIYKETIEQKVSIFLKNKNKCCFEFMKNRCCFKYFIHKGKAHPIKHRSS